MAAGGRVCSLSLSAASRLPDEVWLHIFSKCNGDEVRVFSEVNSRFWRICQDKHLWKTLFHTRTDRKPDIVCAQSFREQYDDEDKLILSIANDCDIAHNHTPYWHTRNDQRGLFGRVSVLIAVSWLHVTGRICGVHTGKYRVIWRMSVLPHASNIFDIKFSGKTSQGHTTESRLPFNNGVLEFGSDYFDFVLPQQLVVTAPFEDVLLECKCTSQEWKSNLVLCSVRLDPVDTQPYAQRYRQNGQRAVLTNTKDSNLPHRQLESMRPRVGASYRLWKPWTVYSLYEEISLAMFAIVIAVAFAYMLLNGTK